MAGRVNRASRINCRFSHNDRVTGVGVPTRLGARGGGYGVPSKGWCLIIRRRLGTGFWVVGVGIAASLGARRRVQPLSDPTAFGIGIQASFGQNYRFARIICVATGLRAGAGRHRSTHSSPHRHHGRRSYQSEARVGLDRPQQRYGSRCLRARGPGARRRRSRSAELRRTRRQRGAVEASRSSRDRLGQGIRRWT